MPLWFAPRHWPTVPSHPNYFEPVGLSCGLSGESGNSFVGQYTKPGNIYVRVRIPGFFGY